MSGVVVKYFQLLRLSPVIRVQVVIRPERASDSVRICQIETALLKFHSAVALKYNHLPYQNTIIYPPAVTSDSVVRLELREHLRINPAAGRLELLTGIAHGLHHIHDLQVVHGYLEFGTVEADQDGTVRISDFWRFPALPSRVTGLMTNAQPSFIRGASESGPSRPSRMKMAKAIDMYAFGILAWELFTGESPLRSTVGAMITADIAPARLPRPNHPELSDEVWDMVEKCLEVDPDRRLTAASVEVILEAEPVYVVLGSPSEFC